MEHGHSHGPVGDPAAAEWLWRLVERLSPVVTAGDAESAGAILRDAQGRLSGLLEDGNPRTRAQARAVVLVAELIARGAMHDAAELLTGEVRRSFPGRAELGPDEIALLDE